MALKVWLPLTQDLRNLGTQNVEISNTGATLDNNGKLGKCYSFNGTSTKITNTFPNTISSPIGSLACWLKMNALPATNKWYCLLQIGTLGGYANCQFGLYIQYNNQIVISIKGSSGTGNIYSHSLQANQWYHLCTTFDGTIVKLYINGIEVFSKTAIVGSYTTASQNLYIGGTNNFYLNGFLNDARYYDHCLSPTEIKEISRGLVRHYKFNNTNIIDSSLNNINGTTTGTLTTSTDSGRYSNSLVFSGNQRIQAESLPSEVKTVSVWAKTTWESVSSPNYQFIFHDRSAKLCMGFASAGLLTYVGSSNGGAGSYVATSGKYLANQWNHIVIIVTGGTTRQVYINGQLATNNANNYFNGDLNKLLIGCRHLSNGYQNYFKGQLSDFRAYATELSEADILELYKMGAKIDSKNKFHTYELVEDSSTIKINKKGQLQINELNETTGINFDSTKDLNANELIEI